MHMRVVPSTSDAFPEVYEALLHPMNPRLTQQVWYRLFEPQWGIQDRSVGTQLVDGDRVVGFASFIHARLPRPDSLATPLCNISTWVTEPAYGAQAMSLVMPVLALRDVTITNLTPTPTVYNIFMKLGFRILEDHLVYIVLASLARGLRSSFLSVRGLQNVLPRLPAWECSIALAHAGTVEHLWFEAPEGRSCFVMYQVVRRWRLRTARVVWITPGVMPDASVALAKALFRASGAVLVELEGRHAGGRPPSSFARPLRVPRLYRSPSLAPAEVPSAYSELVLLGI
jgi:hypothetical protein